MELKDAVEVARELKSLIADDVMAAVIVTVILIAFLLRTLVRLSEVAAKVVKASGEGFAWVSEMIRGGVGYREHIQRRKQFLSVLASDLASIGKAEAWNDQNFTDLEAEVQIEGGYFASVFDRLRKRKSFAQRREKSLIGAIDGSVERCLLLTGDPGAGKSVALRHLAMQMIEREKRSRRMYSPIPLYINLRELTVISGEVDSRSIKNFVIDNVRRGDSDTAEYLRSNWDTFHQKGGWFFLFDSFDEIPAVLHSSNDDAHIDKYGRAIQQFMDGLGGCRGVLASREYKSPKALPWPKLRILPLSDGLQEELVGRTFLSKSQKSIALRALSVSQSSTFRNPLFLTLLCRHVKQYEAAPKNEHQLLYRHVDSLVGRDNDFVQSKWGLTPQCLRKASSELATLFAFVPDMGLAPTIDELRVAAQSNEFLSERLESIVEALTYVKIGRMDVAASSIRERRFAFSHRRYHEAIFADTLSSAPSLLDAKDLLTNKRWREYAVAMLQTADLSDDDPIILRAKDMLVGYVAGARYHEERVGAVTLRTYAWEDDGLAHLLQLMVDAKMYNPSPAWRCVEVEVERFFGSLWKRGDYHDRLMVIRYGGAGDAEQHSRRIDFARRTGIPMLQEEAVSSCQFASSPTAETAEWIRKRVVQKIMQSRRNLDALRWEALAAQLPGAFHIGVCLERAKSLRQQHRLALAAFGFVSVLSRPIASLRIFHNAESNQSFASFKFITMIFTLLPIVLLSAAMVALRKGSILAEHDLVKMIFAVVMICSVLSALITNARFHNMALPRRMRVKDVISVFTVDYKLNLVALILASIMIGLLGTPGLVALWVSRRFGLLSSMSSLELVIAVSGSFVLVLAASLWLLDRRQLRKYRKHARVYLNARKSLRSAISSMSPGSNVLYVCECALESDEVSHGDLRRTISLLSVRQMASGQSSKFKTKSTKKRSLDALYEGECWSAALSILLARSGRCSS